MISPISSERATTADAAIPIHIQSDIVTTFPGGPQFLAVGESPGNVIGETPDFVAAFLHRLNKQLPCETGKPWTRLQLARPRSGPQAAPESRVYSDLVQCE